jgi:hypothetical protein
MINYFVQIIDDLKSWLCDHWGWSFDHPHNGLSIYLTIIKSFHLWGDKYTFESSMIH